MICGVWFMVLVKGGRGEGRGVLLEGKCEREERECLLEEIVKFDFWFLIPSGLFIGAEINSARKDPSSYLPSTPDLNPPPHPTTIHPEVR